MKLFKCTVCSKVLIFDQDKHSRFSSFALDETDIGLSIHCCSKACEKQTEENIESGKWRLPHVKNEGYFHRVTRPQKGYLRQPDQIKLKREFNSHNGEDSHTTN